LQERRVRADDQHPALGQLRAVGVQQVGGAVQGHGGLAGAGAALHHQHPGVPGADDTVLLGLDGGDDVAHPAGAASVQRGQQRGLAGQPRSTAGTCRAVGGPAVVSRGQVENLVVDAHHGAPPRPDVAAPPDPLRGDRGGDIERARRRGPPVHQQRFIVLGFVENAEPADVPADAVAEIQAAEYQPVLGGGELGQPVGVSRAGHIAFDQRLRRFPHVPQRLGQPGRSPVPQAVQPVIEHRDVLLLASHFRV
jgi:hypothetical protein